MRPLDPATAERNRVLTDNWPLIVWLATETNRRWRAIPQEELLAELALIAVRKFDDWKREYALSTFLGQLMRSVLVTIYSRATAAKRSRLRESRRVVATAGDDGDPFLDPQDHRTDADPADVVADREALGRDLTRLRDQVLPRLNPRDRDIAVMRWGLDGNEPLTLTETGERLNLTRERIRQLEDKVLEKCRRVWVGLPPDEPRPLGRPRQPKPVHADFLRSRESAPRRRGAGSITVEPSGKLRVTLGRNVGGRCVVFVRRRFPAGAWAEAEAFLAAEVEKLRAGGGGP